MEIKPNQLEQHQGITGLCPWCKKENIPQYEIEHHRNNCPYRRPVTSIKSIGIIFRGTKK